MGACLMNLIEVSSKIDLDSPVLLIDGFQRLYSCKTHIIINGISRMILSYYIHNTSVYRIGYKSTSNYYSRVLKTTVFDPILKGSICSICDDEDILFIYQSNGDVDCYKLPINIDSQRIEYLSFTNIKSMQFINKNTLLAFIQHNKANYIGIVNYNRA
eukprot:93023_1